MTTGLWHSLTLWTFEQIIKEEIWLQVKPAWIHSNLKGQVGVCRLTPAQHVFFNFYWFIDSFTAFICIPAHVLADGLYLGLISQWLSQCLKEEAFYLIPPRECPLTTVICFVNKWVWVLPRGAQPHHPGRRVSHGEIKWTAGHGLMVKAINKVIIDDWWAEEEAAVKVVQQNPSIQGQW